jgi:hypothetical protein
MSYRHGRHYGGFLQQEEREERADETHEAIKDEWVSRAKRGSKGEYDASQHGNITIAR